MANKFLLVLALGTSTAVADPVMEGYDVVEYFSLNDGDDGVKGDESFKYVLNTTDETDGSDVGSYEVCATTLCDLCACVCVMVCLPPLRAQFWFSSSSNLEAFASDPWSYAPRYGAF